jgi:signal transduction histidine kinase
MNKNTSHEKELIITVEDNGSGIPSTIINNIFDPFFTTKEPGRGTGLGLSISKGIIEAHHGRFWIDNECKNTRFCIEVPERQSSAQTKKKAS